MPPIFYLFRDFSTVLGEDLSNKLSALSERIVRYLQKQPSLSAAANGRLTAFLKTFDPTIWTPKSPEEWGEYCVCAQMAQVDIPEHPPIWNSFLSTYIGSTKERIQEGYSPKVTLLDFSCPLVQKDLLASIKLFLKLFWSILGKRKCQDLRISPMQCLLKNSKTVFYPILGQFAASALASFRI